MNEPKGTYIYGFEKLEVWQLSIQLTKHIYQTTAKFPEEEKFGLISQLRRAAVSVTSNIAEGNGRAGKDKANFIRTVYTSLTEIMNQLIVSHELGFLDAELLYQFRIKINELTNKVNAWRKATLRNIDENK